MRSYRPCFADPESSHLSQSRILLVLQRVVLAQDAHLLVGVDGAAHDAPEHVEARRVLRRVELSRVHHQRTLRNHK